MKTRMLIVILSTLSALAALTACGGGGGGGGGENSALGPPSPVNWMPPDPARGPTTAVTSAANAFSVGSMALAVSQTGGREQGGPYSIAKTADGLVLSAGGGYGRSQTISVAAGDYFRETASGLIVATKDSYGRFTGGSNVSYRARDTITLGGNKVQLSHSDFGLWESYERWVSDGQSPDDGPAVYGYSAFYMGDPNKATGIGNLSGNITFSGTALAEAHGSGGKHASLVGTAELAFTGNFTSSNLDLRFNNFYNFNIPVAINGSGAIVATAAGSLTTNGNNTTGIYFPGMYSSRVSGQFYGDTPGSATEAAGRYTLQSTGQSYTTVNGSFGIKR